MKLIEKIGSAVINKRGEEGVIVAVDDYIKVNFGERTAKYALDAFLQGILVFVDQENQKEVAVAIEQKRIQDREREEQERIQKEKADLLRQREKNPNDNMVFRSQICDGGTEDCSNWFKGPCSCSLRKYHIHDPHQTFCNRGSVCKRCSEGALPESAIEEAYRGEGLCYESKILLDHVIKAGWDIDKVTGKMIAPRSWRLKDDHLAILMTVEPGKKQSEAIIYSVFLTSETTQADALNEGSTKAAPGCFIDLTIQEARQMQLWKYMPAVEGKDPTKWGSGLFRYVSDGVAARILADIVEIVKKRNDPDQTAHAEAFLQKFLSSFGSDVDHIPPRNGAIK